MRAVQNVRATVTAGAVAGLILMILALVMHFAGGGPAQAAGPRSSALVKHHAPHHRGAGAHRRRHRAIKNRHRRTRAGKHRRHLRHHRANAVRAVMAPSVASWYYDSGSTACGFHAGYGVANRTLPCGTHVKLSYGGHSVVAIVDDRGPFVSGRSYDLDQNTARALGMWGVATVYTAVV